MTLLRGEVVLIRMQFHQAPGSKIRPAPVVLDTGDDDFVAAPITSQPRVSLYDLPIEHWRAAGLNVPSYIRIHKLTVLAKAEVVRNVGSISTEGRILLDVALCRAFCPRSGDLDA
jgi:mRNA interferase MazF